jgi:hypothetical protein
MPLRMKRTGNGKGNRRSFDCDVRKCANLFAQDDRVVCERERREEREQTTADAEERQQRKQIPAG